MLNLLTLCWEFFLTGLFSIGGGLATLPFLQSMAQRYPWFSEAELTDMIAISEATPGSIGINTATYAGFRAGGLPGALASTIALVLPSILIILLISRVLDQFRTNKMVNRAFYALHPASLGLILGSMASVFVASITHADALAAHDWQHLLNLPAAILFVALFMLFRRFPKLHPVALIAVGAVVGIVLKF